MSRMSQPYEHLLAAVRDRTAYICLDVQAPRDAPTRRFIASLFEPALAEDGTMRPPGQGSSFAVTPEQARALLAAGAEWKGPAHLRAEVIPTT